MRNVTSSVLAVMLSASLVCATGAAADTQAEPGQKTAPLSAFRLMNQADLDWSQATVKDGVRRLTLHGDPRTSGSFVQRVIFPAGFRGAAHTHPVDLHVLVIRGRSRVGFSADASEPGVELNAGGYAFIPAHQLHWEAADEETEVTLFGVGPLQVGNDAGKR